MYKKFIVITLILSSLAGCVPPTEVERTQYIPRYPEIACVDDSKTSAGWSWCHRAGFSYHTSAGLSIDQVDAFPADKEVILFGLGINTAYKAPLMTSADFEAKFDLLKAQVPDTHIKCLVADVVPYSSVPEHHTTFEEIKAIKKAKCDSWIYYDDWGYHHNTPDGVHGSKKDVDNMTASAIEWYNNYKQGGGY